MLDEKLKEQLKSALSLLDGYYKLVADVATNHPFRNDLIELLQDVSDCSEHISYEENKVEGLRLSVCNTNGDYSQFSFRAVPAGHEFSSLIIAILNIDGKGKNIPDDFFVQRIRNLKGEHKIKTYISLSCTNCPEVVQSLNLISILNRNIQHEIIDGAINESEANALSLQAVPSVFVDNQLVHAGKASLSILLEKLENKFGTELKSINELEVKQYDAIIVGGGPAGVSAAIYSARKGLNVALIADKIGGQVKETVGIENFISKKYTTGKELADDMLNHMATYPIDIFENRSVENIVPHEKGYMISLQLNEQFFAPAVIIATGASWRKMNVPGEEEYIGRGVAFCPHCDGPFYKDKEVAVIGGGNSGIEAAIDLSGICKKVTVIEFLENLKADMVLQEAARKRDNIEIITNSQVTHVLGNGEKVTAVTIKNRGTNKVVDLDLSAVFVQIGLLANSAPFKALVNTNAIGEIQIDEKCRTNLSGIYAAGDVSTVPYKQIIIAMGEGAKAALSAFEDRISGKLIP